MEKLKDIYWSLWHNQTDIIFVGAVSVLVWSLYNG